MAALLVRSRPQPYIAAGIGPLAAPFSRSALLSPGRGSGPPVASLFFRGTNKAPRDRENGSAKPGFRLEKASIAAASEPFLFMRAVWGGYAICSDCAWPHRYDY